MKQEVKHNLKKNIANTFGSSAYLIGFLQWLWAATLYLSVIQSTTSFIFPKNDVSVEQPSNFAFTLPDPLSMIIATIIVVTMIILTIYAFVVVPRSIVKTSNKIVHKTAETIAPIIINTQHKQITKRSRLRLTSRLILAVKLLLILIPLMLTAASKFLDEQPIDYSIAMIVGYGLACFSVVLFVMQYLIARLLRVKMSDLW